MKYELTNTSKVIHFIEDGSIKYRVLRRIKALKSFSDVIAGELGGFVETEENLSQEGNCWVYDDAYVADKAAVRDNTRIKDNGSVEGKAIAMGNCIVRDNCTVTNSAILKGNATLAGNTVVSDTSVVDGYTVINGSISIEGDSRICSNTCLSGEITIQNSIIKDSEISGAKYISDCLIEHDLDYLVLAIGDVEFFVARAKDGKNLRLISNNFSGIIDDNTESALLETEEFFSASSKEFEFLKSFIDFAKQYWGGVGHND